MNARCLQSQRDRHRPSPQLRGSRTLSARPWPPVAVDHAAHFAELHSAIFCLCPPGWAQWTVRFFESVQTGCLPVTFAPRPDPMPLRMPFEDHLDYSAFTVNVPPREIPQLKERLHAIASNRTHLRAMQRALWRVRSLFDWTDASEHGAFHRTLEALHQRMASKLGHSH